MSLRSVELQNFIGQECDYLFDYDSTSWGEDTTIRCKVTDFEVHLEGAPSYRLSLVVFIQPIEITKEFKEFGEHDDGVISDMIACMGVDGVSSDFISFT